MENLKLKMIDFTMKNNEIKETDMIFYFNNKQIKLYICYETGELKKIDIKNETINTISPIQNNDTIKLIGNVYLDYEFGFYEYVEIENNDILKTYNYKNSIIYITNIEDLYLEIETQNKNSLFFDKEYNLIGFKI